MYDMVCESILMYGVDGGVAYKEWKEANTIHGRLCKKISVFPRFAANWVAELQLRRDSSRGKVLSWMVKYWRRFYRWSRKKQ
jgi:hypothetical protein